MDKNIEKQIDEILTRSISQVLPTKEEFKNLLLSGKKLKIYIGADATGPQLHIGHATNFMLLEKLRQMGHDVTVLFGDFTAMIGDPTDKNAARIRLTKKQVAENILSWREQVSHVLSFDDSANPAKIVKNSEWLSKLDFSDLIDLASNFTVQQMMERDMFEKRIKEAKPVYVHEFFYPLMQGYDSVHLDVNVEIGGTDQTFNMLVGRTLQKKYNDKEKFVISTTLLINPVTGKKLMSKSEGGFVALNDSPNEMFGKIMALPDETIIQVFIDCTYVSMEDIKKLEKEMEDGDLNPRDAKLRLAGEIVEIYHGEDKARDARDYFIKTFSQKEIPENVAEFKIDGESKKLAEILVESGNAKSLSDARRKIEQGGVSIDEEKLTDAQAIITKEKNGKVLKIGKLGFIKIAF
ncbi:MAG TPA: tyrosine--tRNA ligase [Candidatus Moranbacteria bacterium]|nr:tyrosine--tRNA ligase [Candidatus Moranbacteria bacterium]HRY28326.1 tyrosine--tRNA ligase [Candidatus Moranbacteria bacterium]HSA08663.1 tyrosine--tRNA ligase [Candidatus Moranbacteria bacterium]